MTDPIPEPVKQSPWAPIIVLGCIAGLVTYEIFALKRPGDSWPTITSMTVHYIKAHWWAGVCIFGVLGWLIVHFAKRVF